VQRVLGPVFDALIDGRRHPHALCEPSVDIAE